MIFLPYVYVLETQEHRLGLAGLLVVPCLGLVWPGPVLPALPTLPWTTAATTPGRLRRPGVVAAVVQGKAGKAGKTGPGQTKPRQGTTSKPAKPGQPVLQPFWGGIGMETGATWASCAPKSCLGLAGLPVVPCLG